MASPTTKRHKTFITSAQSISDNANANDVDTDDEIAEASSSALPPHAFVMHSAKTFADMHEKMCLTRLSKNTRADFVDVDAVNTAEAKITKLIDASFTSMMKTAFHTDKYLPPPTSFDVVIDIDTWPTCHSEERVLVARLVDACPNIDQKSSNDISSICKIWASSRPWPDCIVLTVTLHSVSSEHSRSVASMSWCYGLKSKR
jgi:hypothetical protein